MGFWLTLIAVICKAVLDALVGPGDTSDNAVFAGVIFNGLAVILTVIGVLTTVPRAEGRNGKLRALAIHLGIWVAGYFLVKILVPVIIAVVGIAVVLTFLGFDVLGWLTGLSGDRGNSQDDYVTYEEPEPEPEPEPKKHVKVWKENGFGKDYMKVSSDGERYYDPDDGEWHRIE